MVQLVITYNGTPEWPSEERFEERIEKLLRKNYNGSGYGFGGRDFTFSYRSRDNALKAAKTVRAYIKKERVARYRNAAVEVC